MILRSCRIGSLGVAILLNRDKAGKQPIGHAGSTDEIQNTLTSGSFLRKSIGNAPRLLIWLPPDVSYRLASETAFCR
jgi:hypothetical protein